MAIVRPFRAWRPKPELASNICELPYDVMSTEEARELAAGNPSSFLHISKPEIDFPRGTDPYSMQVYAKGKENWDRLVKTGQLLQDSTPCYYLYRQMMGRHSQIGLVAVASCEEYAQNIVKKHELTRPDKEEDRVRHIETLNAQTGPAFLVFRSEPAIKAIFDEFAAQKPEIDFVAPDQVRHSVWTLRDALTIENLRCAFANIPYLYIADGHHRSAAASRVWHNRAGAGNSAFFLSVLFPHDQVQILPYNRVLKDLNGHTPDVLLEKLASMCKIHPTCDPQPSGKNTFSMFLAGRWHRLEWKSKFTVSCNPIETLDAALLQKQVLAPFFAIDDPRTSKRIDFVGGIRGISALEKLVNSGQYACAFALHPTSIEDLMTIADAGGIMPPKSTWFEPKLRDGICSHPLN
jgi:uncharacterized protein (DUF1015 family)